MRRRKMIFDNTSLSFTSYKPGYHDENYNWIEDEENSKPIVADGDLQPYNLRYQEQQSFPEGFEIYDTKIFITDIDLPTMDDVGFTQSATTKINNRTYYIWKKKDYSNGVLSTDSIFYVLVRQKQQDGTT